jgi:hypothetical protein
MQGYILLPRGENVAGQTSYAPEALSTVSANPINEFSAVERRQVMRCDIEADAAILCGYGIAQAAETAIVEIGDAVGRLSATT